MINRTLKRAAAAVLALLMVAIALGAPFTPMTRAAEAPVRDQVVSSGGQTQNSDDGITISKTIAQVAGMENVFDITLRVESRQSVVEIAGESDAAIVVVMDISNTMTEKYGNTTRYAAAMEAVNGENQFIDQFAQQGSKLSQIGYVAFNTDAHMIAPMQPCYDDGMAATLKNTIATETANIIYASGYAASHSRFTNVEAGLAMAKDMLDAVDNENKYIVLLSDGFPTTYLDGNSTDYRGYDPYTPKAAASVDGSFYDEIRGVPCSYGTSYSDRAAIRAREMATAIKSSGTEIYSIGIDVGGQTIQKHIDNYVGKAFSVVDVQDYQGFTQYELGSTTDSSAFENWLRNSIGSGHYYDSTNSTELQAAFHSIFAQIKEQSKMSETVWQVTDPMNAAQANEYIDFLQFFEKDGATLHAGNLSGQAEEDGENTAIFDAAQAMIQWDLKNSGYWVAGSGSGATYIYELKYRVRLENERADFAAKDNQPIDSNGRTTVTYKVREESNDKISLSEDRELEFKIPQIKGYVADLTFTKTDDKTGETLAGVSFSLTHDDAACLVCKLTGVDQVPGSMLVAQTTAVSDSQGVVTFRDIPSGHIYTLQETETVPHYILSDTAYTVELSYGTVTLKNGETALEAPYVLTNVRRNSLTIEKTVAGDRTNADYAEGAFRFQLICDGQVVAETALPAADGTWSYTFDDLADGRYTLLETNQADPADDYTCKTGFVIGGGEASADCEIDLNGGDRASVVVVNTYTKPEVTQPEVTQPEVTQPEVTQPEVTQPEVTQPEATQPEVTQPEVTQPEVTQPEVTQPEVTQPEVTQPEVTQPEVTQPEVTQPEVTQPEVTQPEATQPEVTQPEVTQPEVTQPEVTQPEVTQPEVTQPQVTQPEVTQPEVTQPEVTQPEVTQPEVTQPQVTQPDVTEPEDPSNPSTGDSAQLLLWASILLASVACLTCLQTRKRAQ